MSDIFGGPPGDEGDEPLYDPSGFPLDYAEVEDPYGFWHGEMPDPWWYDDVSIENAFGDDVTMRAEQWWEATITDDEFTNAMYGMDVLDIIHELEEYGLWDADDWERWRELYE